MIIIYTKNIT